MAIPITVRVEATLEKKKKYKQSKMINLQIASLSKAIQACTISAYQRSGERGKLQHTQNTRPHLGYKTCTYSKEGH